MIYKEIMRWRTIWIQKITSCRILNNNYILSKISIDIY